MTTEHNTSKLLEFQKRVSAISKDSVNPFFKSKYFDVNTVIDTIKPILNEVGLVVTQPFGIQGDKNVLQTNIWDGDKLVTHSEVLLPEQPDVQKFGAAVTYFRRYALVSLLLLQGEEDDDGNKASQPVKAKVTATVQHTDAQYLCSEHGNTVKLRPAGVTKQGKAYDAFYSCTEKSGTGFCKARLTDLDHNEVQKNPETGKLEVIKRQEVEFEISTADMPY